MGISIGVFLPRTGPRVSKTAARRWCLREYAFTNFLSGFVEIAMSIRHSQDCFHAANNRIRPAFVDIKEIKSIVRAALNLRFGGYAAPVAGKRSVSAPPFLRKRWLVTMHPCSRWHIPLVSYSMTAWSSKLVSRRITIPSKHKSRRASHTHLWIKSFTSGLTPSSAFRVDDFR